MTAVGDRWEVRLELRGMPGSGGAAGGMALRLPERGRWSDLNGVAQKGRNVVAGVSLDL